MHRLEGTLIGVEGAVPEDRPTSVRGGLLLRVHIHFRINQLCLRSIRDTSIHERSVALVGIRTMGVARWG